MTKRDWTFTELRQVVRSLPDDLPKSKRAGYGDLIGIAFDREAWEKTLCHEAAQEAACQRSGGCGQLFQLGWAGNSTVRCGAPLNSFGKISQLECHDCEAKRLASAAS